MYPNLFGFRYLNTYGICIVIGIVLCFVVGRYYARVKGGFRPYADAIEANTYATIAIGGLVSMVGQSLFVYLENPTAGFRLTSSATFLSGLIGGIVAFLVGYFAFVRPRFGPRFVEVLPVAPLCITIAHAFGRLGCFFAGCCYGRGTDSCLGVVFPGLGQPVYPTQLFEAAFLFLLFGLLFFLVFKRKFAQGFALYLLAYGVFRFLIEFIRGDNRGALIGPVLSPSQELSILLVFGSIVAWGVTRRLLEDYRANPALQHKIDI